MTFDDLANPHVSVSYHRSDGQDHRSDGRVPSLRWVKTIAQMGGYRRSVGSRPSLRWSRPIGPKGRPHGFDRLASVVRWAMDPVQTGRLGRSTRNGRHIPIRAEPIARWLTTTLRSSSAQRMLVRSKSEVRALPNGGQPHPILRWWKGTRSGARGSLPTTAPARESRAHP